MPVIDEQTKTGSILIKDESACSKSKAIYARVSSSDQKKDLDQQIARLVLYANKNGRAVTHNGHRPKLMKLLTNSNIRIILVEHRDRLMRFGAEYVESAL